MAYQRTQIYLEPEHHRKLLAQARQRRVSLAALIREVVSDHLTERGGALSEKCFDSIIGIVDAEATDVAADEAAYREDHLRRRYERKVEGAVTAADSRRPRKRKRP